MTEFNISHLEQWLGKTVTVEAPISVNTANLMAGTLNQQPVFTVGDPLPPAWHWLYFHQATKTSDLGNEGHAKLGRFLPPVPLPRRMWAGGSLSFKHPLRVGDVATKRSTVTSIRPKQGRSGQLCFVVVEHEVRVDREICLTESQTIVYREAAKPGQQVQTKPASAPADASITITPDPVLLFRYSALTFNAHRIHYDVDYCRNVEGYPDLVVHGPLIATLLLDLAAAQVPADKISGFEYQARSPLYNRHPFTINGRREGDTMELWAANSAGGLAMAGRATLAG